MWFWSPTLPVVLVTIISLGCDESPVSSSFPLSSLSHLLLVQTHHQIVRSVITISFPMHQHRRCHNRQKLYQYSVSFQTTVGKLITRRICLVWQWWWYQSLQYLNSCLFQESLSRRLRRSAWRTAVRRRTSRASSPSSSTGCSTTSARGHQPTSLSTNHGAQLSSMRLVSDQSFTFDIYFDFGCEFF